MTTLKGPSAILYWCKESTAGYNGVDVTDFGQSWKDGLAMCALMHKFHPEKIPFETLTKEDPKKNYDLAFDVAEELGVPRLLEAEDMLVEPYPDRQSLLVYLSEVYQRLTGAVPVSGLGSNRSSVELPPVAEDPPRPTIPEEQYNTEETVPIPTIEPTPAISEPVAAIPAEDPIPTIVLEPERPAVSIHIEEPKLVVSDAIGMVKSTSGSKMITKEEQEELFRQRDREAKEALAFEEEIERKKLQWKSQTPAQPAYNPRKLIRRVTGTVEEWQTKAKKVQEKFSGPSIPSSPRAGDLHKPAAFNEINRMASSPVITFKDKVTTEILTTGDEQITKKVEEISKEVDGKETVHITKTEIKEQHFNNQIRPSLLSVISERSSNNNSGYSSLDNSNSNSASNSATHSRNNSSDFSMTDLVENRRSDSWKQEKMALKRLAEERDREDEEFINKLREEREERERKKQLMKDKLRKRRVADKIKHGSQDTTKSSSEPIVNTAPMTTAPIATDVPRDESPSKPVLTPIVAHHNKSNSTLFVIVGIVVLVFLLYFVVM